MDWTGIPTAGLEIPIFLSGWAVLGFLFVQLLRGKGGLVFRRELEAAEKNAETFKAAWETSEAAKGVLAEQMGELNGHVGDLTTYAQTAAVVLASLDQERKVREELERRDAAAGGKVGGP